MPSGRHLHPVVYLILILPVFASCGQSPAPENDAGPDYANAMLWHGGPIITMDADQPRAEAVVTSADGSIVTTSAKGLLCRLTQGFGNNRVLSFVHILPGA